MLANPVLIIECVKVYVCESVKINCHKINILCGMVLLQYGCNVHIIYMYTYPFPPLLGP